LILPYSKEKNRDILPAMGTVKNPYNQAAMKLAPAQSQNTIFERKKEVKSLNNIMQVL